MGTSVNPQQPPPTSDFIQRKLEAGYREVSRGPENRFGFRCQEIKLEKGAATGVNTIHTYALRGLAVVGTVLGVASGTIISSLYREATWHKVVGDKTTSFVKNLLSLEEEQEQAKALEYDPKDKDSVRQFLEKAYREKDPNFVQIDSHLIYLPKKRGLDGTTRFLIVENGNWEKTASIAIWKSKDGKALDDPDDFYRAVNVYCKTIYTINKEWDKAASEIANQWAKERDENPTEDTIKNMRKMIERQRRLGFLVIDPKDMKARVFGPKADEAHMDTEDTFAGTVISLDSVKESVKRVFHKDSTKYNIPLQGTPPHRPPDDPSAAPPATPPPPNREEPIITEVDDSDDE